MFEVLLTLAVIAIVAWSIFQNYYPPPYFCSQDSSF